MATRRVQAKKPAKSNTRWFEFRQNNSGGYFKGPAMEVWVEAHDASEANRRAESVGIYFGGEGDCSCCGDRWYPAHSGEEGVKNPPSKVEAYSLRWDDSEETKVPVAAKLSLKDKKLKGIPAKKMKGL